ncbi:MAG: alpha/beta hydrolase family protein [Massilia sp.]
MYQTVLPSLRRGAPLFATLATLAALAGPASAAEPAPPPVQSFFDNPAFSDAILAPDAKSLAVVVSGAGKRDRLAVVDLVNNSIKVVAAFSAADIGDVDWVNNERLVFNSHDKQLGPGDEVTGPGLYAVNRDGSNFKQLVDVIGTYSANHAIARTILPFNHYVLGQHGAQDSDAIYVRSPHFGEDGRSDFVNLVKLDTVTGRASTVVRPGKVGYWMLDAQGQPRLTTTLEQNVETVQYLDPATGAWRKLIEFDGYLGGRGSFTPLGFAPDGALYAVAYGGHDLAALYTVDVKTGTLSPKPVMALKGFDFSGRLIIADNKLLGIRYTSDAKAILWFDEKMKANQAAVDALLPNTINLLEPAARAALPLVLVASYSDRQPYKYSLYNTSTGKLNPVGETHPGIDPDTMGEQEFVRIKARDGRMVPAWLTLPHGSARKQLPMVVLVHGGPYVRGTEWGWKADDQFLASRGYAVLQPEFRGSAGYGSAYFRAGWKQWGLAMQDDIADATRWAIAQGIADPKRICIAGASYGGYATLMGLINDPDLYKCGVEWVGVTDLTLLHSGHWSFTSDMSDGYRKYGMPTLVGDPVKDAAQFKATSPIEQAARIKQPLLMAYGAVDQRVPLYHGRKFRDAVQQTNDKVEMVIYDEEAHGWTLPKNRYDFWTRVEAFLARQIGADAPK